MVKIEGEGEGEIRIAQVSCGTIYGNVQHEIERAAEEVGAEIFVPEVDLTMWHRRQKSSAMT